MRLLRNKSEEYRLPKEKEQESTAQLETPPPPARKLEQVMGKILSSHRQITLQVGKGSITKAKISS